MQSTTGDTPQRKGLHGLKGANDKTKIPCSLCRATQSNEEDDVGGQIGDRYFDIVKNRRTRGQVDDGRRQLTEVGLGTPSAVALSMELGVVQPDGLDQPRILFDLCSTHNPMLSCGPELLHLDCLVRDSHALCPGYLPAAAHTYIGWKSKKIFELRRRRSRSHTRRISDASSPDPTEGHILLR